MAECSLAAGMAGCPEPALAEVAPRICRMKKGHFWTFRPWHEATRATGRNVRVEEWPKQSFWK